MKAFMRALKFWFMLFCWFALIAILCFPLFGQAVPTPKSSAPFSDVCAFYARIDWLDAALRVRVDFNDKNFLDPQSSVGCVTKKGEALVMVFQMSERKADIFTAIPMGPTINIAVLKEGRVIYPTIDSVAGLYRSGTVPDIVTPSPSAKPPFKGVCRYARVDWIDATARRGFDLDTTSSLLIRQSSIGCIVQIGRDTLVLILNASTRKPEDVVSVPISWITKITELVDAGETRNAYQVPEIKRPGAVRKEVAPGKK